MNKKDLDPLLKELQHHIREYISAVRESRNQEASSRHIFILSVMEDIDKIRRYHRM